MLRGHSLPCPGCSYACTGPAVWATRPWLGHYWAASPRGSPFKDTAAFSGTVDSLSHPPARRPGIARTDARTRTWETSEHLRCARAWTSNAVGNGARPLPPGLPVQVRVQAAQSMGGTAQSRAPGTFTGGTQGKLSQERQLGPQVTKEQK